DIFSPLTIRKEGVVLFGTEFKKLVAVQNTGNQMFVKNLYGHVRRSPTIDFEGRIYMATSQVELGNSKIEVFGQDGSYLWELLLDEPGPSSVIIGDSNYVYVRTINFWGGGFGKLYKIDKIDHSVAWTFYYGPNVSGSWAPTLCSNGTIYLVVSNYFSGNEGRYYAIDCNGNITWELDPYAATGIGMTPYQQMVPGDNGNIYAVAEDDDHICYLIAIEDSVAQLSTSAWPMYKHDVYFTSQASNIINPQPNIVLDKILLDFGFVHTDTTKNMDLTVYNKGQIPLELNLFLLSNVFSINTCKQSYSDPPKSEIIQPNDSIIFTISFSPVDTTMYSANLLLLSNDPDQPEVVVTLKGKSTIEGDIKWMLQVGDVGGSPAIDDFGNIYVSGNISILRIKPEGKIDWEMQPSGYQHRYDSDNITVSNTNDMIFVPWENTIIAVDSSGIEQWVFDPPPDYKLYPVAIDHNGHLIVSESASNDGGHLYCLDIEGQELWNFQSEIKLRCGAIIEEKGNIITGGSLGILSGIYSINPEGNLNWWEENFLPNGLPAIGYDNLIYIGGRWGLLGGYTPRVRAYDQAGVMVWEYHLDDDYYEVSTSIVTHPNQFLIFAATDTYNDIASVIALDTFGEFLWMETYNGEIYSTPAIADDGTICFGCNDGYFHVLNPDGSEKWNIETGTGFSTSPAIDKNGMIYFATNDGLLYAVYGENGGLATSTWPMVHHDTKHTSAVDSLTVSIPEKILEEEDIIFSRPNPFDSKTDIMWKQNTPSTVKITISDIRGKNILTQSLYCQKGTNKFRWEGKTIEGNKVKTGVYICTLNSNGKSYCLKLIKQ
nr:PQQ-binding-like beta-propeller repeat protein [Bacteroidota bacterium]